MPLFAFMPLSASATFPVIVLPPCECGFICSIDLVFLVSLKPYKPLKSLPNKPLSNAFLMGCE
jgi:hypothetical protein